MRVKFMLGDTWIAGMWVAVGGVATKLVDIVLTRAKARLDAQAARPAGMTAEAGMVFDRLVERLEDDDQELRRLRAENDEIRRERNRLERKLSRYENGGAK